MANTAGDFKPGNQYWRLVKKPGRERKYPTPAGLEKKCIEYFEWVVANPLIEARAAQHNGIFVHGELKKPRAMTLKGLCLFIGLTDKTWTSYRDREGFGPLCRWVDDIIWTQKFEGAAADLFNVQIIARELGLADRQDITSNGESIKNDWHVHPTTTIDEQKAKESDSESS